MLAWSFKPQHKSNTFEGTEIQSSPWVRARHIVCNQSSVDVPSIEKAYFCYCCCEEKVAGFPL